MSKRLRFAHIEGYTDVSYSDDGQNIITCGSDGDYRVWNGFEDDDPVCVRVGDEATCITFKKGKIYVGTDMHALQIYSASDNQPDGIVYRFTANVTHVVVSKDGTKIAAGSCDMMIRVKDVDPQANSKDQHFEGHTAPILSVDLDPRLEFLVSSSCDGTVRIWSLNSRKQVHSWEWAPRSNDFSNCPSLCRVMFEPVLGKTLAVPVATTIKIIERSSWKEVAELKDERLNQASICCWSPCGKYLAATGLGGVIVVWDVKSRAVIHRFEHEKGFPICSVAWKPGCTAGNDELAFCDSRGHLGIVEKVTAAAGSTTAAQTPVEALEELDGDNDISISQIKKSTGFLVDEENGQDVFAGVPGDSDDDVSSVVAQKPHYSSSVAAAAPARIQLQPAFQPGSSPIDRQQNYMVWNGVGIVRCYNSAGEDSTIDIEFHDTQVHHNFNMVNALGHTMATLSAQALLLACPAEDDNSPSKIVCVHLASWDNHKEWSTSMPAGEDCVGLALGDGWAAVGTSRRLLRFFTLSGLQRALLCLAGPLLCMAGSGSHLAVAFHYGAPLPGQQQVAFGLLHVDRRSPVGYRWIVAAQPLPIAADCQLAWLGFTDEGSVAMMDTGGLLQIYQAGCWIPVLDTKQHIKGKSDHYFIVGVNHLEQSVRCILCRGSKYPATLPRPNLSLLDMRLPVCDAANEKSQLEESLVKACLLEQLATSPDGALAAPLDAYELSQKADRGYKESLMKMFALACQSDRDVRAIEVAQWMNNEQLLQLAVKYSTRARKRHLADRITQLAEQLVRESQQQHESDDSGGEEQQTPQHRRHKIPDSQQDMFDRDISTPSQESMECDNPFLQAQQQMLQQKRNPQIRDAMTIRPLSQTKKNPFAKKADVTPTSSLPPGRVIEVFDHVASPVIGHNPAKENLPTKSTKTKQPTLFSMKKSTPTAPHSKVTEAEGDRGADEVRPAKEDSTLAADDPASQGKSGFTLWLHLNRPLLQTEHSDKSEAELSQLAALKFRALAPEERQKYNRKRKASVEASAGDHDGAEKRNRPSASEKLQSFAAE